MLCDKKFMSEGLNCPEKAITDQSVIIMELEMEPDYQQQSSPQRSGWMTGLFQLVFVIAVIVAALGLSRA